VHEPRADGADANPVLRHLPSKTLREHQNSGLGTPISRKRRQGQEPSRRSGDDNVPTLAPLNQKRYKSQKRIDNPKQIDVNNPPPILQRSIKKTPSNSNPSISHNDIGNPMLSKNMLRKPPNSIPISDINLKSTPTNLDSGGLSSRKVNIHTQDITPLPPKRNGSGSPNPTASSSDKSELPAQRRRRGPHKPPSKLPRSVAPVNKINELGNHPSNNGRPLPDSPMPSNDGTAPKPLTPRLSSSQDSGSDKRIPRKRDLLHRSSHPSSPRRRNPPNHISSIKLNPITSITIRSGEPSPQTRYPPNQLRQNRNLKSPNIPRTKNLPKNIPLPPLPHPLPHLIKIRP
jgi:hypothetical protein